MLMARADLCRDGGKPRVQVFDVAIAKVQLKPLAKTLTADQSGAGEVEIEIAENALRRVSSRANTSSSSRWPAA